MVNFVKLALTIPEITIRLTGFLAISALESLRTLITTSKSLNGEIVLITGGGSGIGRGLAIELAKLGCIVVIWDMNITGAEETASFIRKQGGISSAYRVDVTNRDQVYEYAQRVTSDIGEVTILVNNAGIVSGKKIFDPENNDAYMEKTVQVNTIAHFWTAKAFLPKMVAKNHGHFVTIASSAGLVGVNGLADYCASKFGAVGFHESVAAELHSLGKSGVQTLVVNPYYINTGMFDGVKTKNDILLPILEPTYVVNQIVSAIRRNVKVLCMPWIVNFLSLIKAFPVPAQMFLSDGLGVGDTMNDFKGRK